MREWDNAAKKRIGKNAHFKTEKLQKGEKKERVIMVWKRKITSPELQEVSVCEQEKGKMWENRIRKAQKKRGKQ